MDEAKKIDAASRMYFSRRSTLFYSFLNNQISFIPRLVEHLKQNILGMVVEGGDMKIRVDCQEYLWGVSLAHLAYILSPRRSRMLSGFHVIVRRGGCYHGPSKIGGYFDPPAHAPCIFTIVEDGANLTVTPRVRAIIDTTIVDPPLFDVDTIAALQRNVGNISGPLSLDTIAVDVHIPILGSDWSIEKQRSFLDNLFWKVYDKGNIYTHYFNRCLSWRSPRFSRTLSLTFHQSIGEYFGSNSEVYLDEPARHSSYEVEFKNEGSMFSFTLRYTFGVRDIEVMGYSAEDMGPINSMEAMDLLTLEDSTVGAMVSHERMIFIYGGRSFIVYRSQYVHELDDHLVYRCRILNSQSAESVDTSRAYVNLRNFGLSGEVYVLEEDIKAAFNYVGLPIFEVGQESDNEQLLSVVSKVLHDNPGNVSSVGRRHCGPGYGGPVKSIRAYQ